MAKAPGNHRKAWSAGDVRQLQQLARGNTPTGVIGLKLERSPQAVQAKASEKRISLKPMNQAPYGPRRSK